MLEGRGFSLRTAVDLIAGAIDVWLHPSLTLAAATTAHSPNEEEKTMLSRVLRLECGALAPGMTRADQWKASITIVVFTLALTLGWMGLHATFHDNPIVGGMSLVPFMSSLLVSTRYTYLKGRSPSVQWTFIAIFTIFFAVLLGGAGWLASKI